METEQKGKTLWEMLCERLRAQGNGAGIAFYGGAIEIFVLPLSVMSEVIWVGPCGKFGLPTGFCFMDAW